MTSSRTDPSPASRGVAAALGAVGGAAVSAVGAALGGVFGAAARVRRTKPLHPAGQVGTGLLEVTTPAPWLGVPALATGTSRECLVRWSRSAGFPSPLPDIEGFALRIGDAGGGAPADLLFASSGDGRVTRYTLRLRRPRRHGPMSTLLPVDGATGPLMFLAEPLDDEDPPVQWRLSVAAAGSSWHRFATIRVAWGPDRAVRFDAVEHLLPGTRQYPLVARLREPAYAMARRCAPSRPS